MADYQIREHQLNILNILRAVDSVCRSHDLHYYLWAGTMLGAVRHKGFIPWDDDADICMPRPDYERLVRHCREWLPAPFELACSETTSHYPGFFAKIIDTSTTLIEREHYGQVSGIYIDVFPIDGVPANMFSRRWMMAKYAFYKKVSYFLHRNPYKHGHGIRSWVPLLCQRLFDSQKVYHNIHAMLLSCDYETSAQVADYDDGIAGIISKDVLGQPTAIAFEEQLFMGVERYDSYLRQKYGDYMLIPDAGHQRQHHFFYIDYKLPYHEFQRLHRDIRH